MTSHQGLASPNSPFPQPLEVGARAPQDASLVFYLPPVLSCVLPLLCLCIYLPVAERREKVSFLWGRLSWDNVSFAFSPHYMEEYQGGKETDTQS